MNEDLIKIKQLEALKARHQELDNMIDHQPLDDFTRQRLKKERLQLRTQITLLEQLVYPDIIA